MKSMSVVGLIRIMDMVQRVRKVMCVAREESISGILVVR